MNNLPVNEKGEQAPGGNGSGEEAVINVPAAMDRKKEALLKAKEEIDAICKKYGVELIVNQNIQLRTK